MSKRPKARYQELQAQVAELRREIRALRECLPYHPVGKATEIIRLRETNPCASLQAIGDKVNLSRERVRQILYRARLPTVHVRRLSPQFQCLNCRSTFTPRPLRPKVKQARYDHESFCTKKCDTKYHLLTLTCEVCGITFHRPQSHIMGNIRRGLGNHFFCSQTCKGRWAGKTFGFAAHPENAMVGRRRSRKRKWDYEQVWAWREKTGWGCRRLSRALGIPELTITYILAKTKAEKVLTTSES